MKTCIACGGPDDDGEGYRGLCSHCADISDDTAAVRRWLRKEGYSGGPISEDDRIAYAAAMSLEDRNDPKDTMQEWRP